MPRKSPWPYSLRRWIIDAFRTESEECIDWPFNIGVRGYPQAVYKKRPYKPHRLMCALAHGRPPKGKPHAAHLCGNKACMNKRHLAWASAKENEAHKREHGTYYNRSQPKLTEEQVREIRARRAANEYLHVIGAAYGISEASVRKVVSLKSYAYVT